MHLEVTFKNLKPREELRRRADALFGKLERFLDESADGQLLVTVEHDAAVLDLVINTHGEAHKVHEEDAELRTALDSIFHKVEMKLRRRKEKRTDRRRKSADTLDGFVEESTDEAAI